MGCSVLFLKLLSIPFYWFNVVLTILIIAPLYFYRMLVVKLAKRLHTDWTILDHRDAFLAVDKVHTKPLIALTGIAILDGSPNLPQFRDLFEENVIWAEDKNGELCYPKFQQYFESWLGYLFWKWDEFFAVENHIKMLTDAADKEREIWTEEDMIGEIGRISTKGFPRKRPFWEILFVKNLVEKSKSGNGYVERSHMKSAVIFRLHHGMADGYSLLKVLMSNLCGLSLDDVRRPLWKQSTLLGRMRLGVDLLFRLPYLHTRALTWDTDNNIWFLPENALKKDCHSTWTNKIPIDIIKETSRKRGVTFTAVLIAGLAGGIRKYFQFHGMEKEIPEIMRAMSPLPWKGHPIEKLVNHWSSVTIPLPTGGSTSQERVKQAENTMTSIKNSPVTLANFYIVPIVATWPVTLREIMWQNYIGTMIMSNFPGPSEKISFGGQYEMTDCAFWAPIIGGNGAIAVTMLTYVDSLRLAFLVDKAIVSEKSEANELTLLVEQEFYNMKRETTDL